MNVGLLILRIVVGGLFVGHGTQKLFGWFGGHGVQGTGGFYANIGFRPGPKMAVLAGVSEAGGGLLLMLGFLTPLGAAAIIGVMTAATLAVHAEKGMWNSDGGMEFPITLAAAASGLAFAGPGAYSVDHALGWTLSGIGFGVAATLLGILAGTVMNAYRLERLRQAADVAPSEERRAA
jgi:putative oxidoreductase